METVRLVVGGQAWTGWQSVSVSASILDAARSFALGLNTRKDSTQIVPETIDIAAGASCALYVGADNEPIVTGTIDKAPSRESARDLTLGATGRSKTARLVKCSSLSGTRELHGLDPIQVAQKLAADYDVQVLATVEPGKPFDIHQMQVGESAFETIERFSRERGWLVTDDGYGHLVLCTAGDGRGDSIVYGQTPVIDWDFETDAAERFTEYRCLGQRAGSDAQYGAAVAACQATWYDDGWTTERLVKVIRAEGQADVAACKRRAQWEALRRAGKSATLTVRLPRWRQTSGALWEPNLLCHVVYPRRRLDLDLLVVSVDLTIDNGGESATLTLGQPGGYDPKPPKVTKPKAEGFLL